ncbi:MAG TPA: tripartite tricarboxylate transporter substrate binding protein [Burkholderiales bacterium]
MSKRIVIAALACAGIGLAPALGAQDKMQKPRGYPERPLTIVVPYGPGGGSDKVSRAMGSAMEKFVGQPIQVVNKPGAAGLAAVPDFMSAPADGYTIIQHIDDSITHFAAGKLREDPTEDWSPLGISQITFSQLYVRADDKRFDDWDSLLKHIKANPGKVSVANVSGAGTMERVQMSLVEQALGIKTNQISYDKPSERYASLIGGHVDVLFEQPGDIRQFLAAGQMKPVLTFLKERPAAFKDVPAIGEIAPDVPALLRFRGFFVKSGVPEDRLKYLEWAFAQGYRTPEYQKFNKENYMDVIDSFRDRKGAIQLMKETATTYKKAYKELGITK